MAYVQQFYADQSVFVTGATGFLGIVLVEKLLHACPEVRNIFILVRKKKGRNVQERIDALFAGPVFDPLRREYPEFEKKVVGIPGDIAEERLGISSEDYDRLTNEVSIIFHLAASIRFNDPLSNAVIVNVNSTKRIVDLAKACKNLKAGVYVSTAYSHCIRKKIDEELSPAPLSYEEVNKVVNDFAESKLSEIDLKESTEKVLGDWPNTYSFSKAIAEGVVAEYAKELPFAVYRPSIVMNAYREPVPGWIFSPMGLPGMMCAGGLGLMRCSLIVQDCKVDIVPVDYVCNGLVCCAWETSVTKRRHEEKIPVYNYVSGSQNPVTWRELHAKFEIIGPSYPSNHAVFNPGMIRAESLWFYNILEFCLHLIPALIIDSIARLFGRDLKLYKYASKLAEAVRATYYFTTQEWDFSNQRIQNLWKNIGHTDRRVFPFDIGAVDWDEHTMMMIRGLRTYLVGESEDNLLQARRRYYFLYYLHTAMKLMCVTFLFWITWKAFSGRSMTIRTVE